MAQSRVHPAVHLCARSAPGCRERPLSMTGIQVSLEQMCPGGSCIRAGLRGCLLQGITGPCQHTPGGPAAGSPRQRQELAAYPTCREPSGAQHNLSLAGEVTASFACHELPALLSIPALGPGTDGASCSWRRRSSLPGAEPSAWQGQPHLLGRRQKLGNLPAFAAFWLAASHSGSKRACVFAQREKR